VIVLGLSAWFASVTNQGPFALVFDFVSLEIAVSVITLVTILVSFVFLKRPLSRFLSIYHSCCRFIVGLIRRGAFTSMLAVEIGWTFVLWVLWLAAAGRATDQLVPKNECLGAIGSS